MAPPWPQLGAPGCRRRVPGCRRPACPGSRRPARFAGPARLYSPYPVCI